MTAPLKRAAGFALLLTCLGCATAPPSPERVDFPSPRAALMHIGAGIPEGIALQALADIRITGRGDGYFLKLAIVARKPASLRLEAIPLLGPPAFFLSVRDGTLNVYLPGDGAYYTGRATKHHIARYAPLNMDPEEIIAVLMGTAPPLTGEPVIPEGGPEKDHYRLDLPGGTQRQSLWLRMQDGFLERIRVEGDPQHSYRVRFEDPVRIEGFVFPQKIDIVFEGGPTASLGIRLRDLQILRQPDPAIFDLTVPAGLMPVRLD